MESQPAHTMKVWTALRVRRLPTGQPCHVPTSRIDNSQEQPNSPGTCPPCACRRERGREKGQSFALPSRGPGWWLCLCLPSVGRSVARAPADGLHQPESRVHRVAPAHPPSRLTPLGGASDGSRSSPLRAAQAEPGRCTREGDKSAEAVPLVASTCKPTQRADTALKSRHGRQDIHDV